MERNHHFFKIEDQWNVIHLSEKPNGFAILLLGDVNHYVNETTSSWLHNYDRYRMIQYWQNKGYTIFSTNLFGRNWGSQKAVEYIFRLYHLILRKEILNEKIHIVAEGMGGLVALKLMEQMREYVRSVAFLSPCLDLKSFFESEKENRLFYKRFIKEISQAYEVDVNEVEDKVIKPYQLSSFQSVVPAKIWHSTHRTPYKISNHSRKYEELREEHGAPIPLALHLYEKRFHLSQSVVRFLNKNEKML